MAKPNTTKPPCGDVRQQMRTWNFSHVSLSAPCKRSYLRPQCYLHSLELPVGYFHRVPFLAVGKSEKQIYSTFAFPLRAPECASLSPICAWNWCRRCPTFGSTCPGIASTLSSVTHTFMSSDSPQQNTLFLCLSLPDKILGLIVLKCEQLKTSSSKIKSML